ncbi:MAG: PQQ-binding-like beta-propeller repeat protein [Haloferacaceae archaeon]
MPSITRRRALSAGALAAAALAGCSARRECPPLAAPPAGTDWPQPRHCPGNAATAAADAAPDALDVRWRTPTDARFRPPLVAGGVVYVPGIDRPTEDGRSRPRLFALDADTGERRWRRRLGDAFDDAHLVAAAEEGAYVLAEPSDSDDDWRLTAVDADGAVRWTFDAPAMRDAALAGDAVCAVTKGSVVVLDAASGEVCRRLRPGDGPLSRWLSDVRPVGRPAVADGAVYAAAARHDVDREDDYFADRLVAVDASSAERRWEERIRDVGFVEGVVAAGGRAFASTFEPGRVVAVDGETGERLWTRGVGEGALPVAATGDVVVASGSEGNVAFDAETGTRRWTGGAFYGPPVVAGERIYGVADAEGLADALVVAGLPDGRERTRVEMGGQVGSHPVVAGGSVFVHVATFDRSEEPSEHAGDRLVALG